MDIWKVLGIAPTDDARAIKRAYAEQLRAHHPEDDPEGFQRVQEAYERAREQARSARGAGGARVAGPGAPVAPRAADGPPAAPAASRGADRAPGERPAATAAHPAAGWTPGAPGTAVPDAPPARAESPGAPHGPAGSGTAPDAPAATGPRAARREGEAPRPAAARREAADGRSPDGPDAAARAVPAGSGAASPIGVDSSWRAVFLERSADGAAFAPCAPGAPGDYIDASLGARSRLRADAAQLVERLAGAIDRRDLEAVRALFRDGGWVRCARVPGFDETLAEMLASYLPELSEADLNGLEADVAHAVSGPADAPAVAGAFGAVRDARAAARNAGRRRVGALVLFCIAIAFSVARMQLRIEHDGRGFAQDPPAAAEPGGEPDAMEEHMARVEREKELLAERAAENEAFVLAELQARYGEPFELEEPGIWPFAVGSGTAACTAKGEVSGAVYDVDLAYGEDRVVTEVTGATEREG